MRFQIPQFIEVENKIFGPLTFQQFVYLAGAAGLAFAAYTFLPFFFAVLVIVPIASLAGALAFYKPNGKPFVKLLESMFRYSTKQKLYIWKKRDRAAKKEKDTKQGEPLEIPRLSQSKLKDLAWSLDVHKKIK